MTVRWDATNSLPIDPLLECPQRRHSKLNDVPPRLLDLALSFGLGDLAEEFVFLLIGKGDFIARAFS